MTAMMSNPADNGLEIYDTVKTRMHHPHPPAASQARPMANSKTTPSCWLLGAVVFSCAMTGRRHRVRPADRPSIDFVPSATKRITTAAKRNTPMSQLHRRDDRLLLSERPRSRGRTHAERFPRTDRTGRRYGPHDLAL